MCVCRYRSGPRARRGLQNRRSCLTAKTKTGRPLGGIQVPAYANRGILMKDNARLNQATLKDYKKNGTTRKLLLVMNKRRKKLPLSPFVPSAPSLLLLFYFPRRRNFNFDSHVDRLVLLLLAAWLTCFRQSGDVTVEILSKERKYGTIRGTAGRAQLAPSSMIWRYTENCAVGVLRHIEFEFLSSI